MIKKTLAMLLVLAMILSLAACGSKPAETTDVAMQYIKAEEAKEAVKEELAEETASEAADTAEISSSLKEKAEEVKEELKEELAAQQDEAASDAQ